MVNIPLLRKMVEWVETEEKLPSVKRTWYQGTWFRERIPNLVSDVVNLKEQGYCGTNMCIAGKIVEDAGWEFVDPVPNGAFKYCYGATKDGVFKPIREVAGDELGLDREKANQLFQGWNRAPDLRRIAERYAGERL